MDQFELCRLERQGTHQSNTRHHSSLPSSPSMSRNSSTSSLSSLIHSVVGVSVNLNQCLSEVEPWPASSTPLKRNSIEHTSPCENCRNFNSTNEQDMCSRCRKNQSTTRSESFTERKSGNERQPSLMFAIENRDQKCGKGRTKDKQNNQLERQCLARLLNSYRQEQQLTQSQSSMNGSLTCSEPCLSELGVQSKLPPEIKQPEASPTVRLSPERTSQCQQRQLELDHAVTKLLETLRNKTDENIEQILEHWSHLKHLSLEQFRPKAQHLQLFGQLLQSSSYHKRSQDYLEAHDQIQGAMHILQRILTIFHEKHSFTTVNQLFDSIGQTMMENLRAQLESLLDSYKFELDLIRARIHFYQSQTDGKKNFDWMQCIQVDYPLLIEKISNDFIIRVPQVEQTLVQMLRNSKKHLLSSMLETDSK